MSAKNVMSCVIALIMALALAACGGDSNESEEHEAASPAVAKKEAAETREALTAALATYKSGDKSAAEEQVAEAYVSHFEEVEGPLESRNEELNEDLEHAISGAAMPFLPSSRSTSSSWPRSFTTESRTSESGLPERILLRSSAKVNSVSSTRFGLRRRSGTSTNSKWSR